LTSIDVDSSNPAYTSVDGVLFDKNRRIIIAYPAGKKGAYAMPALVTSIGNYAFGGCENLTSIAIPPFVRSIGDFAFAECSSLTNISIPFSVAAIGDEAFYDCDSLTSVTLSRQTQLGYNVFPDWTEIKYRD
jgi:hypothetical protein